MLQQTQVKTVIPFWERWLRELPTIRAAAEADSAKLHKLWEGLGYYTRVRNLQRAAQVIVQRHDGKFPTRFDDVLDLPGIGRYTAGAICSIAFNQPTPILDGNVIRVLTRTFGIAENPKDKATNARLWHLAGQLVAAAAPGHCSALNQSFMELGALVCRPRNPQCPQCPIQRRCVARREGRIAELPNLGVRAPATARRFIAFAIRRDAKFLVRQRPAGVVNAHLWEFPNVEVNGDNVSADKLFAVEFGPAPQVFSPLITIKHSITRYRITLEAFRVEVGAERIRAHGALWKTPAQMHRLAFTSAHRKILRAVSASPKS